MEEKPFIYKKRTYKKRKKKVVKKKRIVKEIIYYATYIGKHKHIVYTGIKERVIPGKEYLINDKKIAASLATSKNWEVREHYIYEDIK